MDRNSYTAARCNGETFVTQILMFTSTDFKRYNKYRKSYFSQKYIYSTSRKIQYFNNTERENPSNSLRSSPFEIILPVNRNVAFVLRITFVFNSSSCDIVLQRQ